jgi:hypothetical protein
MNPLRGAIQLADENLCRAKHQGLDACVSRRAGCASLATGRFGKT